MPARASARPASAAATSSIGCTAATPARRGAGSSRGWRWRRRRAGRARWRPACGRGCRWPAPARARRRRRRRRSTARRRRARRSRRRAAQHGPDRRRGPAARGAGGTDPAPRRGGQSPGAGGRRSRRRGEPLVDVDHPAANRPPRRCRAGGRSPCSAAPQPAGVDEDRGRRRARAAIDAAGPDAGRAARPAWTWSAPQHGAPSPVGVTPTPAASSTRCAASVDVALPRVHHAPGEQVQTSVPDGARAGAHATGGRSAGPAASGTRRSRCATAPRALEPPAGAVATEDAPRRPRCHHGVSCDRRRRGLRGSARSGARTARSTGTPVSQPRHCTHVSKRAHDLGGRAGAPCSCTCPHGAMRPRGDSGLVAR